MEEQFVPYELALKLKELGFDEPCIMYYDNLYGNFLKIGTDDTYWGDYTGFQKWNSMPNSPWKPFKPLVSAPLWQQAFDWFREEKDLLNHLTTHLNTWGEDGALETSYGYRIMIDKDGWKCDVWEKLSEYETYEEARQACLEKLISYHK